MGGPAAVAVGVPRGGCLRFLLQYRTLYINLLGGRRTAAVCQATTANHLAPDLFAGHPTPPTSHFYILAMYPRRRGRVPEMPAACSPRSRYATYPERLAVWGGHVAVSAPDPGLEKRAGGRGVPPHSRCQNTTGNGPAKGESRPSGERPVASCGHGGHKRSILLPPPFPLSCAGLVALQRSGSLGASTAWVAVWPPESRALPRPVRHRRSHLRAGVDAAGCADRHARGQRLP